MYNKRPPKMLTIPSMKSTKVVVKSPDTGTPLAVEGIDTRVVAEALGEELAFAIAEALGVAEGEAVDADADATKAGEEAPTAAAIAKFRVTVWGFPPILALTVIL